MINVSFKTNGSHRLANKIRTSFPKAWSIAASLRGKDREWHIESNENFETLKPKLKNDFKARCIKCN